MVVKIRSFVLVLILIMMLFPSVVSGQDELKNLLIGGIWQLAEDQTQNQGYAKLLNAEYVPTYYSRTEAPTGQQRAMSTSPNAWDISAKAKDLLAVRDATPEEKFYTKDPDTGILIMKDVKPKATDLNGLGNKLLQKGKEYDIIYSHSGGTRTAVSALLYQGVKAKKLVLISPTTGGLTPKHQELFKWELQQLLDLGIVEEIVVYQAKEDTPPVGSFWQAKFKLDDIKGNFKIKDLSGKLEGKKGDAAHKQMWDVVLKEEIDLLAHGQCSAYPKPNQLSGSAFPPDWQTPSAMKTSGLEGWGKHPKGWGVSQAYVNAHPEIYGGLSQEYINAHPEIYGSSSPSYPQSGSNSGSSGHSSIPTSNDQSNPNGLTPEQQRAIQDAIDNMQPIGEDDHYESTVPQFAQCYDGGCYDANGNRID